MMIEKYLSKAILFDVLICSIFGGFLIFNFPLNIDFVKVPKVDSINSFSAILIGVGATLIGFLLTVITVLVTFKNGFNQQAENADEETKVETDYSNPPEKTVFDTVVTKETQFYKSGIPSHLVKVFIEATVEIGLAICILLTLHIKILEFETHVSLILSLLCLLLIVFSMIRSFVVFKLFLNVHLPNK